MQPETVQQLNDDFDDLSTAVSNIPEEIMRELFGDHARIVVTKDGMEVEEYDHD